MSTVSGDNQPPESTTTQDTTAQQADLKQSAEQLEQAKKSAKPTVSVGSSPPSPVPTPKVTTEDASDDITAHGQGQDDILAQGRGQEPTPPKDADKNKDGELSRSSGTSWYGLGKDFKALDVLSKKLVAPILNPATKWATRGLSLAALPVGLLGAGAKALTSGIKGMLTGEGFKASAKESFMNEVAKSIAPSSLAKNFEQAGKALGSMRRHGSDVNVESNAEGGAPSLKQYENQTSHIGGELNNLARMAEPEKQVKESPEVPSEVPDNSPDPPEKDRRPSGPS